MPVIAAAFLCLAPVAVDGDTLRCSREGLVRLIGIDAPELPGHCRRGRKCTPGDPVASTRALAAMISGRRVVCESVARDRYGRILARCSAGGADLSCEMIRNGYAVRRYSRIDCDAN